MAKSSFSQILYFLRSIFLDSFYQNRNMKPAYNKITSVFSTLQSESMKIKTKELHFNVSAKVFCKFEEKKTS